jgi:hypothetical protein
MVLEVEETGLADVASFGAGLAHECHFETHAGARVVAEDGEGTWRRSRICVRILAWRSNGEGQRLRWEELR